MDDLNVSEGAIVTFLDNNGPLVDDLDESDITERREFLQRWMAENVMAEEFGKPWTVQRLRVAAEKCRIRMLRTIA